MKKNTTVNNFLKIKGVLPSEQFENVANELIDASEKQLEAFWSIIYAGYPVSFASSNYKNIEAFVTKNNIEFKEALGNLHDIYPGLEKGIRIKYPEWYVLN